MTRGPLSVAVTAVAAGVSYADRQFVRPHKSGFGSGLKGCTMYSYFKMYIKSPGMQFKSAFLPSAEHFHRRQFARGSNLTILDRQEGGPGRPKPNTATSLAIVALAAESPLSTAALIRAAIGNEIKLIHSMRTGRAGATVGTKEGGTQTPIPIRVTFIIAKTRLRPRSAYLALLTDADPWPAKKVSERLKSPLKRRGHLVRMPSQARVLAPLRLPALHSLSDLILHLTHDVHYTVDERATRFAFAVPVCAVICGKT